MTSTARVLAGCAIGLAVAAVAGFASAASQPRLAVALGVIGLFTLVGGLAVSSPAVVGTATVPVLGGAVLEAATVDDPAAIRLLVLGCAWYVVSEIAWEAIERRAAGVVTPAYVRRRLQEVATVVAATVAFTTLGLVGAEWGPTRTVLLQVVVVLLVVGGLIALTRRFAATVRG